MHHILLIQYLLLFLSFLQASRSFWYIDDCLKIWKKILSRQKSILKKNNCYNKQKSELNI